MNTKKSIYEMLFRNQTTNLAKHEVELAIADDLKNAIAFLLKANDAVNLSIKGYEDAYKKMQAESKGAKSVLDTQAKLINQVESMAKELGINPTAIPNYNDINKSWDALSAVIDKVNQY